LDYISILKKEVILSTESSDSFGTEQTALQSYNTEDPNPRSHPLPNLSSQERPITVGGRGADYCENRMKHTNPEFLYLSAGGMHSYRCSSNKYDVNEYLCLKYLIM
jgi:hypothetical protein